MNPNNEKSLSISTEARKIGNKLSQSGNHSKEVHKTMLFQYNKSIAYAPTESREFIFALYNRALLLLHLKKYNQCIADIDYALKKFAFFFYDLEFYKSKLLCQKVLCLRLMNNKIEAQLVLKEARNAINKISNKYNKIKKNLSNELHAIVDTDYDLSFKKEEIIAEINPSLKMPYVSKAVSIKYNEKYGRHFVANRNIKPGELILVEKSYCAHPNLNQLYSVCSHCLKQTWSSIPCPNCVYALYCSEKCKSIAWKEYHDIECLMYPYLCSEKFHDHHFLLSRLFIKAIKENGIKELIFQAKIIDKFIDKHVFYNLKATESCKFTFYYNLLHHSGKVKSNFQDIDKYFIEYFISKLDKLEYFSNEIITEHNIELQNILFKLLDIITINSFYFQIPDLNCEEVEYENVDIGNVLNPLSSFFNHSCYSNIDYINLDGPRIAFYSTKPIKKDEQLCCSYGPTVKKDKLERNLFLKENYNFSCDCRACKEDWPPFEEKLNHYYNEIPQEKHEKILSVFKDSNFFYTFQPFNEWSYDKNSIKILCENIEICYSNLSTFEAAVLSFSYKCDLWKLFYKVYTKEFQIPNYCCK